MKKSKKNLPFISCIIAAGGSGSRMGADINKIFLDLDEIPVLAHTLLAFENHKMISEIIIVCRECDMLGCKDIAEEFKISKLKTITKGGAVRQDSVTNGIKELSESCEAVLIHDAARPLITEDGITEVINAVLEYGGAAIGSPCKCTIKETDENGFITKTVDRSYLYEVQTPQGFKTEQLKQMFDNAKENAIVGTDDCYLAEQLALPVKMISGSSDNIKITTYDDLLLAEQILDKRKGE
ncbi:MAG: 2-C-methyl-D-erythritol 4-phosphate cytidylyltransferase [Clostridia bacterium]|nr:2-C-methyl-D-erythritol 4-phosphate cytidylyltransferase [Clostridia bacterium]